MYQTPGRITIHIVVLRELRQALHQGDAEAQNPPCHIVYLLDAGHGTISAILSRAMGLNRSSER